jgi:hypothetical protein
MMLMPVRFSRFATGSLVLVTMAAPLSCSDSGDDSAPTAGTGGSGATGGVGSGGAPTAGKGGSAGSGNLAGTGGSAASGGSGAVAGTSAVGGSSSPGGSSSGGSSGTGSAGGASGGLGGAGTSAGGAGTGGESAMAGASGMSGSSGSGGSPACAGTTPIAGSTCTAGESNCFSFFVASRARMFAAAEAFNGSTKGWGGDFRYGTADGLTGADKLCTEIAEQSLPNNCRTWRAFLSTSTVNAISRVGSGPWYDRLNRTIANDLTELVETRPGGITVSTILNNLPNEDGTPHHNEELGCEDLNDCADNHDVLTGSDSDGKVCTSETCRGFGGGFPGGGGPPGGDNVTDFTCQNWTLGTSMANIAPRCGHTWPTGGGGQDDWISHLTENGCAPGFNLVQNGGPMPTGNGSVGDGGGYGAIYCLALSE